MDSWKWHIQQNVPSLYHNTCHRHIVPGQQADNCAVLNPVKLEFTEESYIHSIVIQKDPEGNYHLQSLETEILPQKSVGIEEIDVEQETYNYGKFIDMQTNTYNKYWPNECSREDLLALILVCCSMIFVTALILTIILFLCLCFVLILILILLLIVWYYYYVTSVRVHPVWNVYIIGCLVGPWC